MPVSPLRRAASTIAAAAAMLPIAACGNGRTPVPDVSQPAAPGPFVTLGYKQAGLVIRAPDNWAVRNQRAPLVSVLSSGPAIIAVWTYPRTGSPPAGTGALARARAALIAGAKTRDPSMQLIRSSITTLGQRPAIELDAFERIGQHRRRVRSTHVFTSTREIVLDEYAPPDMFHQIDHAVFSPVKRSLRLLTTNRA